MSGRVKVTITKIGLVLYAIFVFILLWGYSQAGLNPDSYIGSFTSNDSGMWFFVIVLTLIFGLLDFTLNKTGYKTILREKVD